LKPIAGDRYHSELTKPSYGLNAMEIVNGEL
jgi:hypothetical protein